MRAVCFFLFLVVCANCFAQEEATFKIKRVKNVSLSILSDTLLQDETYHLKVYGITNRQISRVIFPGNKIEVTDTDIEVHTFKKEGIFKVAFQIFTREDSLVYYKEFVLIAKEDAPQFVLRIRVVDMVFGARKTIPITDSITKRWLLQRVNSILTDVKPTSLSNSEITTTLKMTFVCKGEMETFKTDKLFLTTEMDKKIEGAKEGDEIIFTINHHSNSTPPDEAKMGPYHIHITK